MKPAITLLIVALLVAGCGRKGDPVSPSADTIVEQDSSD